MSMVRLASAATTISVSVLDGNVLFAMGMGKGSVEVNRELCLEPEAGGRKTASATGACGAVTCRLVAPVCRLACEWAASDGEL